MLRNFIILAILLVFGSDNLQADCLGEAKRQYCKSHSDSTGCNIPQSFLDMATDSCNLLYNAGPLSEFPDRHILPRESDTLATNFAFRVMCQGFVRTPTWYSCDRYDEVSYARVPKSSGWRSVLYNPKREAVSFMHIVSDSEIVFAIETENYFHLYGFRDYVGGDPFEDPDSARLVEPEPVNLDHLDSLKISKSQKAQVGKLARATYRNSVESWKDRVKGKEAWNEFRAAVKDTTVEDQFAQYYSNLFGFDGFVSNPVLSRDGILDPHFFSRVGSSSFFAKEIRDFLIFGSMKSRRIYLIIKPEFLKKK